MNRTQPRHPGFYRRGIAPLVAVGLLIGASRAPAQAPADKAKEAWHGSLALGLTLTRGNSDTFQMNATAAATKLLPKDEFRLGAEFNYALNNFTRSNETTSAQNVHGFADYKRLFTDRFYGDARVDAFHDGPAGVKYRVNIGPAAGYYFIKSDATRLNLEVGPGFQIVKQDDKEQKYVTLRVSERFEHTFNKAVKGWEEINYFPQVDDFGNYLVLGEVGVEAAMTTRLGLRVVCQDKYNSRPTAGHKNNDITLITAVAWKY